MGSNYYYQDMHIAIVVPAYNESKHIEGVIQDILDQKQSFKIKKLTVLVVDDGSWDQTTALAKKCKGLFKDRFELIVLRHKINLGKGAAAKTGCDAACKIGADIIVLMDGDGQHKAKDIIRLINPILKRQTGLVVGVREANKQMPAMMRFGNKVLTLLSKFMFNIRVRDIQSGFRAFTRQTYPAIRWATSQYAMENEMLILASTHKVPVFEVGIPTIYHDNYKGTTALDGLKVFKTMLGWWVFKFQYLKKLEHFRLDEAKIINQ